MDRQEGADAGHRKGSADKHRAIVSGALTVFAREGYTRASIDAISAAACVSTRTVYNHFQDKSELFHTTVLESASSVADAEIAIVDRHLSKVTELESDLIEFAREFAAPMIEYADHFALIRRIDAEAGHIPQAAIEAWQEAGPLRVRRELSRRMREMAEHGMLDITDPDRAATHFMLLVQGSLPLHNGIGETREPRTTEHASAGVRAFLYGYLR